MNAGVTTSGIKNFISALGSSVILPDAICSIACATMFPPECLAPSSAALAIRSSALAKVEIRVNDFTRRAWPSASSCAIAPPRDTPMTWARAIPASSRTPMTSPAISAVV